jgi:hypothetical protein
MPDANYAAKPLSARKNRNTDKERGIVNDNARLQNELKLLLVNETDAVRQFVYDAIPLRAPVFWNTPEIKLLVQLARTSVFVDQLQARQLSSVEASASDLASLEKVLASSLNSIVKLRSQLGITRVVLHSTNPVQNRVENARATQVLEMANVYATNEVTDVSNVDTSWLLEMKE